MKYFHLPTFLFSLSLGFFYIYLTKPKQKLVYVYPSVEEEKKQTLYSDKSKKCFHFKADKTECNNKSVPFPIQT